MSGIVSDASCKGDPKSIRRDGYFHGRCEWQLFDLASGLIVFKSPRYSRSTVNVAEFCGVVDALRMLHDRGDATTPVYSDSRLACTWVRARVLRTKLPLDVHTAPSHEAAKQALSWLREVGPANPVLWWNTPQWSESPADFGRK